MHPFRLISAALLRARRSHTRHDVGRGPDATGIQAPVTLEGAVNSDAFAAFVGQVLFQTVRLSQVVICDNLSVRRRAEIRERIEQTGCNYRFLPAYSPDCNPIKQAFSKLKTFLRGPKPHPGSGRSRHRW